MLLPLLLGVTMGAVTSYTDMKTGFIDDIHVFPTLVLVEKLKGIYSPEGTLDRIPIPAVEGGILYYAYRGFSNHDTILALSGLVGFLLGLTLGVLLYYIGVWASGDALILAGYSALLPVSPPVKYLPPYYGRLPLYPVSILLNSILAVFPFIFAYAIAVIMARRRFSELRKIFVSGTRTALELTLWVVASLVIILTMERVTGYILGHVTAWIVALVIITLLGLKRKVGDLIGVLSLTYLLYLDPSEGLLLTGKTFLVLYTFKVFLSLVKFIRMEVLMEEIPVEELKEWDILGETIFERDGEILRDRSDSFTRLKTAILKGDASLLKPNYGRVIASPTAEGLKREQIEELKKLVMEGRLENRFLRKKSIPFAPALFLGFLISYFFGDLFWWFQLMMTGL